MTEQLYICDKAKECGGEICTGLTPFTTMSAQWTVLHHYSPCKECNRGYTVKAIPVHEVGYSKGEFCPHDYHYSRYNAQVNSILCNNRCPRNQGRDEDRKVVYCSYPEKEKCMDKKYEVIKDFTKYDYVVAHSKMYKWDTFNESCSEFQKDMDRWINEVCVITVSCDNVPQGYSKNFYSHAVKFGFIREVEEEVFYKCGDRFKLLGDTYILAQVDRSKFALINLIDGNRKTDPVKVVSGTRITYNEFKQICGNNTPDQFTKIED